MKNGFNHMSPSTGQAQPRVPRELYQCPPSRPPVALAPFPEAALSAAGLLSPSFSLPSWSSLARPAQFSWVASVPTAPR